MTTLTLSNKAKKALEGDYFREMRKKIILEANEHDEPNRLKATDDAVSAMAKAITAANDAVLSAEDCQDYNFAAMISKSLADQGFTIAPIAKPVADEKLREAVLQFKSSLNNMNVKADWFESWKTIEAALAELAELRAEHEDCKKAYELLFMSQPRWKPIDTLGGYDGIIETWNFHKSVFSYIAASNLRSLMGLTTRPETIVFPTHWRPQIEPMPLLTGKEEQ